MSKTERRTSIMHHLFIIACCVTLILPLAAFGAYKEKGDQSAAARSAATNDLVIDSVTVDHATNLVTIKGRNFGAAPAVRLANFDLFVSRYDAATQTLVVFLPGQLDAGSYLLTVSSGKDQASKSVDFAVAIGAVGPQGPQGPQGNKGDKGDTGPQGIQGIQGIKGDKGDKGDTGPQGVQGIQGAKGDKGDKGDTGPQGPAGAITLPFSTTVNSNSNIFSITNNGFGSAFHANNPNGGDAIVATTASGVAIRATSASGTGIIANGSGVGVEAISTSAGGVGIRGINTAAGGLAGQFIGDLLVTTKIRAAEKNFQIDHPLDPANKYLYHTSVESPDMKNIYDGVAVLDKNGEAVIALPEYFQALNGDVRYQLTCIGGFAPVYVAEEVSDNRFKVAGGAPGMKVSWQITGIRHDAYANKYRTRVEELKPQHERGFYLHPEAFNKPAEQSVQHAPKE